ncbi:MAG: hypothetical protein IKT67_05140 [Lachnospiraceae bacterium]|nr:hypothetical protein [Lachnospiraceae bacterium]
MERRNKLAFWSVQIQYTLIRLLVLYVTVLAGTVVWYSVQAKVRFKTYGADLTFFEQLQGIPLYVSFLITVLGSQVILAIAYAKQEKNRLAMERLLLEIRTVWNVRFWYSVLVTVASFLVHFISVFLLLFADRLLYPGDGFGIAELYPVFYRFRHLYVCYPVMNPWAALLLIVCVMMLAQSSVWVGTVVRHNSWIRSVFPVGLVLLFLALSGIPDMISLAVLGAGSAFVALYSLITGRILYLEGESNGEADGNGGAKG